MTITIWSLDKKASHTNLRLLLRGQRGPEAPEEQGNFSAVFLKCGKTITSQTPIPPPVALPGKCKYVTMLFHSFLSLFLFFFFLTSYNVNLLCLSGSLTSPHLHPAEAGLRNGREIKNQRLLLPIADSKAPLGRGSAPLPKLTWPSTLSKRAFEPMSVLGKG